MTTMQTLSNPTDDPRRKKLPVANPHALGVLSIHLDGGVCRVGCEFCYLGAREASIASPEDPAIPKNLDLKMLEDVLSRLDYAEVAVAISEPAAPMLGPLRAIVRAATARGKPVAITTTASVIASERGVVEGVSRVNLSVDPRKGPVAPRWVDHVARMARAPGREVALIVSLVNPAFAESLLAGNLRALVELENVDKVALSALKPPPPWCDRAFWLSALARLAPVLEKHLDRRLFLDCYVAARILGLGGCPARPDLSPQNEFRACVYQKAADFVFTGAADLEARLRDFTAPAACPFEIY